MSTIIFPMTLIRASGLPLSAWAPFGTGMPDWEGLENEEANRASALLEAFEQALHAEHAPVLRTLIYNARKNFFQRRKMPSEEVRRQFREAGTLTNLLDELEAYQLISTLKQQAEERFEQNLRAQYEALQSLAREDTMRRALLFASHDLLASLPGLVETPVGLFDKKERRTAFSLFQYFTRAVFKTSPLGRFTTVQMAALDAIGATDKRVGEWFASKSMVTPNVALLPAIYEVLLREPAFFTSLSLCLNPCITPTNPTFTEGGWLYFDGEREAFQQIEPDAVAELVVDILLDAGQKMPYKQLEAMLEAAVEGTKPQLQALIVRLVDIGLLEWQLPEQGLSPNWCGSLYQYLGYLPTSRVLTETAYVLQWLRMAARALPFQSFEEAQNLQREAGRELSAYFVKQEASGPLIPPEQLFFEDVAQDVSLDLPAGTLEGLVDALAAIWKQQEPTRMSPFRSRLLRFAEEMLALGEQVDFLVFARAFLARGPRDLPDTVPPDMAMEAPQKVGALLQVYKAGGTYKAVVNAMYPGGGKLFARWLPLFPASYTSAFEQWTSSELLTVAFPWQGWTNANFQPALSKFSLSVPEGRTSHLPSGRNILLGDLRVRRTNQGVLELVDSHSGLKIGFNDMGLEAPDTRPPVMQVLWHLGVPMVSLDMLLPGDLRWEQHGEVEFRRRVELSNLVLARAVWALPVSVWEGLFPKTMPQAERVAKAVCALKRMGVPTRFFGQFGARRERPQFYDMESPLSMLLLEKNMRQGEGRLLLTEMLPMPAQWLGDRAVEFVVEWAV